MNFKNSEHAAYDSWIHWNVTGKCNFDCEYCFGHSAVGPQKVNRVDIDKLLSALDKTGKIFRISFTGGEPFLVPNFTEACKAITEKHFISINTHFTSNKIIEFSKTIDPQRVLFIQASLHFEELKKRKLIDRFVFNYHLLKKMNFNIFAEAVAYPGLLKNLDDFKRYFNRENIDFSFGAFTGIYKGSKYPESYTNEELEQFELTERDKYKFSQKGNLCNAGVNAAVAFSNGNVFPCFQLKSKLGNIYEEIKFNDEIINCPAKYCGCPLNIYDEYLFNKINLIHSNAD